ERNDYRGPGTGYRLEGARWELLQALPHELDPRTLVDVATDGHAPLFAELGDAEPGAAAGEVVVAVGPAFGASLRTTIGGRGHAEVVAAVAAGIREGGATPRLVRVRRSSDVAFLAHAATRLSGSGVAVGLQSKGTAL